MPLPRAISPKSGFASSAYRCVERRGELAEAIAEMQACRGAYLLEVRVESEDNVFPMVPAGAPVAAIRLE